MINTFIKMNIYNNNQNKKDIDKLFDDITNLNKPLKNSFIGILYQQILTDNFNLQKVATSYLAINNDENYTNIINQLLVYLQNNNIYKNKLYDGDFSQDEILNFWKIFYKSNSDKLIDENHNVLYITLNITIREWNRVHLSLDEYQMEVPLKIVIL